MIKVLFVCHGNICRSAAAEVVLKQIGIMAEKMKRTLSECRAAVCGRTPYVITQEDVLIQKAE